jgi:hypothetical protein
MPCDFPQKGLRVHGPSIESIHLSYRGALTFSSSTPTLSRLSAVAGAFEFEVAFDGTTRSRIWEWK